MKIILAIFLFFSIFLVSCSKVRESAGVNRKNIDEFMVIENPPLIMPPDFNLLPPEQLSEKNIDNVESELAKEILFGLEDQSKNKIEEISTMENILNQTNANKIDSSIREEINEQFANEKQLDLITWEDEVEVLDSIAESARLRNQLLDSTIKTNNNIPTVKIKNKIKKKKRFFFF